MPRLSVLVTPVRLVTLVAVGLLQTQTAAAVPGGTSTCLRNYGKTVCGYSCLAAHGAVACARTSAGICEASAASVVCWDPPDVVRVHYKTRVPRPRCLTRNGETRCGYACESHGDEVKCATTPDGICRATALGVTCWDPPPTTYCADDRPLPRPQCVALDGKVACGYQCEARHGELGCAATPAGTCQALPEGIVCSDPEPPPMCGAEPCTPEPAERSWCPPPPEPDTSYPSR
jgi:hypothetical protein